MHSDNFFNSYFLIPFLPLDTGTRCRKVHKDLKTMPQSYNMLFSFSF
jgi:hypothetical protein